MRIDFISFPENRAGVESITERTYEEGEDFFETVARIVNNVAIYLWNTSPADFEKEFTMLTGDASLAKHLAGKFNHRVHDRKCAEAFILDLEPENQRRLCILAEKKYDPEYMALQSV